MENNVQLQYNEKQSFITAWMLGLLMVVLFVSVTDVYSHYAETGAWDIHVGVWIVLVAFLQLVLSRLYTTIDQEGIQITFLPFAWRKRWAWGNIANVNVRKFDFMEYGGWGYRLGRSGVAYTCKGWYGIDIELKNGKKILIGTQCPVEVEQFIHEIKEDGSK